MPSSLSSDFIEIKIVPNWPWVCILQWKCHKLVRVEKGDSLTFNLCQAVSTSPLWSWRCSLKAAESCDQVQLWWWKPPPQKMGSAGKSSVCLGKVTDKAKAVFHFHSSEFAFSEFTAWWGCHLPLSDDCAYTPISCKQNCRKGSSHEGNKSSINKLSFWLCWVQAVWEEREAALTFSSYGLHVSLKGYLGKYKAWTYLFFKETAPSLQRHWKLLHSKGPGNFSLQARRKNYCFSPSNRWSLCWLLGRVSAEQSRTPAVHRVLVVTCKPSLVGRSCPWTYCLVPST